MSAQWASPLFILRERCAADLFGVLRDLKTAGFDGIEFLGFFGHTANELRRELNNLNLRAVGNHVPLDAFYADIKGTLDDHAQIGCEYITVSNFGEDWLHKVHKIAQSVSGYGITLLYHNHAQELRNRVDNNSQLESIMDSATDLKLEPDLGWIEIGGGDAAHYLTKYRDRSPVIHLKDYFKDETGFTFRPTGYGMLNLPKLWPLCEACRPTWYVLDHDDAYDRDPIADLRLSLEYAKTLSIVNKE